MHQLEEIDGRTRTNKEHLSLSKCFYLSVALILWISFSHGDQFQQITSHRPPAAVWFPSCVHHFNSIQNAKCAGVSINTNSVWCSADADVKRTMERQNDEKHRQTIAGNAKVWMESRLSLVTQQWRWRMMVVKDDIWWCTVSYMHGYSKTSVWNYTTIQLYTNIMYYRNLKNRTIIAFEGWIFFKIIIIIMITNMLELTFFFYLYQEMKIILYDLPEKLPHRWCAEIVSFIAVSKFQFGPWNNVWTWGFSPLSALKKRQLKG